MSQINPEAASQTDRKLVEIPKGQQIFDKLLCIYIYIYLYIIMEYKKIINLLDNIKN